MQDAVMQSAVQPFIKLVQGNMTLLTQLSTSPEAMTLGMSNAPSLFQAGDASAGKLARSSAFGELMQGMLKNYAEFMTELGQSSMVMLAQVESALMQAQQSAESVVPAETRGRRAR